MDIIFFGECSNTPFHEGASDTITRFCARIKFFALAISLLTLLALEGHALTQFPHAIHFSGITEACPFSILIALTGHSLIHL